MADLNLSKFKKISSDKNCTTLKHENGHELKIAHGGLDQKLKKKLNELPIYATDGADIQAPDAEPVPDRSPASAAPMVAPVPSIPGQDMASPTGAPSAGAGIQQEQPPLDVNGYVQNEANKNLQEISSTGQDIDKGHITPETYHDLFAKKDTLGKLGTIFGLMVSGAGSGLTGQPNALMAMMDKQIQNDLDAQKTSASNKLNWYNANLAKNLNEAQVKETVARGLMTPIQAEGMYLNNVSNANFLTKAGIGHAAIHSFQQMVDKIPPNSPNKPAADNALNTIKSAHAAQNAGLANQAAAASAQIKQKYGNPDPDELGQKLQQKEQGAAQGPENRILNPKADDLYQGLMGASIAGLDKGALTNQYNQATQAEKSLSQIDETFNNLSKEADEGSFGGNLRRKGGAALAAVPLVGGALHGATDYLTDTPENRAFDSDRTNLLGYLSGALKGTNVGGGQIERVVNDNSPEQGDTQALRTKKLNNIKHFIKTHTDTSLLETYKMAPKHG